MRSGKVFLHLPVDALVYFLVGSVYVHRVFMVDHFFQNERGDVKGYDMGLGYEIAIGGNEIVDIEIVCAADAVEAAMDLVFQTVLIGGFHQLVFDEFHGDGVGKGIDAILDSVQGSPPRILFGRFDF
jgi:hypothetical protein